MKYVAVIEYIADAEKVSRIRPDHRAYTAKLREAGQLAAGGPLEGFGGLLIYECASAEEAERMLLADPFYTEGVFKSWTIRPWKMANVNPALFQP